MVFPLIGAGIALSSAVPTALAISSKVSKFYGKYGNTSLGQATQFGIGYGASTNIGYNLSNSYLTNSLQSRYSNNTKITTYDLTSKMPYGRYPSYGSSSRSRYGSRSGKKRVWSRRYRRYIYVNSYSRPTYRRRY